MHRILMTCKARHSILNSPEAAQIRKKLLRICVTFFDNKLVEIRQVIRNGVVCYLLR